MNFRSNLMELVLLLLPPPDGKKIGKVNHIFEAEMYIDGILVEKAKLPTIINHRRFTPFWRYQLKPGKHHVLIKILNPIEMPN